MILADNLIEDALRKDIKIKFEFKENIDIKSNGVYN